MVYTVKIKGNSKKARTIINLLKALKEDYNFIEITDNHSDIYSDELDEKLETRYKNFLNDPAGKNWELLKKELGENS